MGKNRRLKPNSKPRKIAKTLTRPASISKPTRPITKKHKQIHRNEPTIPFYPDERVLLIGEGDLSFARSLIESHACTNVVATVFESSAAELEEKYPHVEENVAAIEEGGGSVKYGVDATKMKPWTTNGKKGDGSMERIFFNFPHVGGKSTDVNRQVRYNQDLLVKFFKQAMPSLSPKHGSSIIITLFEGEPYTLWNIRDLGRHAGLEVKESFKFQAKAYPGYHHARTLGVVKGKNGDIGGGWKGEERSARSYVFVRKGEGVVQGNGHGKRQGSPSSDEGTDGEAEGDVGESDEVNGIEEDPADSEVDEDLESD